MFPKSSSILRLISQLTDTTYAEKSEGREQTLNRYHFVYDMPHAMLTTLSFHI